MSFAPEYGSVRIHPPPRIPDQPTLGTFGEPPEEIDEGPSPTQVSRNGSATAGPDYMATSGMLTFLPGEVTNTVTVVVIGDTDDEGTETFTVELTGAVNATIDKGTGTATIIEP